MKKLAYRAIDTCEQAVDNYHERTDCLLGISKGQGFVQALGGLELDRIRIAARGARIAEGTLRMPLSYAQERNTFGSTVCEHQAVHPKLSEMAAKVKAFKVFDRKRRQSYDSGQRCDMEAGMAKYFATKTGVCCAQQAIRILGDCSYVTECETERFSRNALLMSMGDGSNGDLI